MSWPHSKNYQFKIFFDESSPFMLAYILTNGPNFVIPNFVRSSLFNLSKACPLMSCFRKLDGTSLSFNLFQSSCFHTHSTTSAQHQLSGFRRLSINVGTRLQETSDGILDSRQFSIIFLFFFQCTFW